MSKDKVVLAYSGGLDTSIILRWLQQKNFEVICFTADVGQGEEVQEAKEKAVRTGAANAFALDLRDEFVRDYVYPMQRASSLYEGYYLLGTSIARPLIAKAMVEIARAEGAVAIAHGATGKGNDQVRFEMSALALEPGIRIIAPWREWEFKGRADLIDFALREGIDVPVTKEKPYSMDANLLHISYEGGVLEDPWNEPPAGMFRLTTDPQAAPDRPETVTVEFVAGDPVAINGQRLGPAALLQKANEIAGRHGVGRVDIVENRYVGMKSRGVYETPGGTLLYHARRAVESLALDREVLHQRDALGVKYAELVYNGYWFAAEREALQAYMDHAAQPVSGTARLSLYKGNASVTGRKSPNSLYDPELVTFEADSVYNQADAGAFIKLNALRARVRAQLQARQSAAPAQGELTP